MTNTHASQPPVKRVMVSSTALDLPEHRKVILDACLRQSMFPMMMEHLPANAADAIQASRKLVEQADLYVGLFAFRYGYIPAGYDRSITQMEYEWAVARDIPRLIFLMDKTHPLHFDDVERGENAPRLDALRDRLQLEQVVNYFTSADDLGKKAINSLSFYRAGDPAAFHAVSDIPAPPEPYIAHPYTLLQTSTLIGRQTERNLLTAWVAAPSSPLFGARMLTVVAMGGMGKSALTWSWFQKIAPLEMHPLAGRLWWSFYESDATFEQFVLRALAYVSRQDPDKLRTLSQPEREDRLLRILDREPYLLVLDGLERLLVAYARLDAARLPDEDLDARTAHRMANSRGTPVGDPSGISVGATQSSQHPLRRTADLRVGSFLRKLTQVRAARILVSSRLLPADLQTEIGNPWPGSAMLPLFGLSDDDALSLWRAFGVSGTHAEVLQLVHTFENHPLLIQALAGVVANDRRAPRDLARWRQLHPTFNPFALKLVQVRSHVLATALEGVDASALQVLHTLAAFRMPATYDTLVALLVGEGKQYAREDELVRVLAELEDRGLLGWDRRSNRYDLHPIVRGVAWAKLDAANKTRLYEQLSVHFQSLPQVEDWRQVERLEDLTAAIELYSTLIGLGRYHEAYQVYSNRLNDALLYRLGLNQQIRVLLEAFFPDGLEQLLRLSRPRAQGYVLNAFALSLRNEPGRAADVFARAGALYEREAYWQGLSITLCSQSDALRQSGAIYEAERTARKALVISREQSDQGKEADSLYWLGLVLSTQGRQQEDVQALQRSLELARTGIVYKPYDFLAQAALWRGDYAEAHIFAAQAAEYAHTNRYEQGHILALRLQGTALLESRSRNQATA